MNHRRGQSVPELLMLQSFKEVKSCAGFRPTCGRPDPRPKHGHLARSAPTRLRCCKGVELPWSSEALLERGARLGPAHQHPTEESGSAAAAPRPSGFAARRARPMPSQFKDRPTKRARGSGRELRIVRPRACGSPWVCVVVLRG